MRFPLHLAVKPPALCEARVLAEQIKAKGQALACRTYMSHAGWSAQPIGLSASIHSSV